MKRYHKSLSRPLAAALAALLVISLCACGTKPQESDDTTGTTGTTDPTVTEQGNASNTAAADTMPDSPAATEAVASDYTRTSEVLITLADHATTADGDGVLIQDNTVTIQKSGSYLLSGSLSNGQLLVDTGDTEKVKLYLNGVSITCADGPAVYVRSAPKKVILCTVKGSVNLLSDGQTDYIVPDEEQVEGVDYPNGTVYAKDDLKLSGDGALFITSNQGNGVSTSDDLEITGGEVTVNAKNHGLRGKDSVTVEGGTLYVTAGGDAVKSAQTEKEGKGGIAVTGGSLYLTAVGDGISAATDLEVSGGLLVIATQGTKSTSGSSGSAGGQRRFGGGMGGFGGFGGMSEGNANKSATSAKGLKAAGKLTVGGTAQITVDSADDALHADDAVLITGGTLALRAADDGIHADNTLTVNGGTIEISESYEGLEAVRVTVNGGTIRVTASDDGFNACGGTSMGGMGGGRPGGSWGRPGQNTEGDSSSDSSETPLLTFNGGYTVINAGGDGIDSNGNIVMTGGTVLIYGPTDNGNGAIDFGDGNYNMTVSGGLLLAVGSSGMAETATGNGQAVLAFSTRSSFAAETVISIVDADGNTVLTFCPPKLFASVVLSCPELVSGSTYTVRCGGSFSGDVVDGICQNGTHTNAEDRGSLQAN